MGFKFIYVDKVAHDSASILQNVILNLNEKAMTATYRRLEVQSQELLGMGVPLDQITRLIDDSKLGTDGWQEMVFLRTDWVGR